MQSKGERCRLEGGQKDSPEAGVSQDGNRIPQSCRFVRLLGEAWPRGSVFRCF